MLAVFCLNLLMQNPLKFCFKNLHKTLFLVSHKKSSQVTGNQTQKFAPCGFITEFSTKC